MRRLVQSIALLLVVVGITTGAASLAEAAAPTQSQWIACRETDTFDACCKKFGGALVTYSGGQSCDWYSPAPGGGRTWKGVNNPQPGSGAPASGDNVLYLPKNRKMR